jgi:large conductance mechanosensitive channel
MKKFFSEFKTFITRGNVMDMAVGVIVGGAFTAIVNGLSNFILKPIINYLLALAFGADSLSDIHTILLAKFAEDGTLDLASSIYIDWGSFINAVLNFFLIALVLFCIVKFFNHMRSEHKEMKAKMKKMKPTKEERKAMKAAGIKLRDREAVKAWYAEKAQKEAEAKAIADAEAAEKARLDRLANPTTEDLLKSILEELKKN